MPGRSRATTPRATAGLRDHAPISWLCEQLLDRGWLADRAARSWLAEFLVTLTETAVDKVLKTLVRTPLEPGDKRRHDLEETIAAALIAVPVRCLPSLCLLDRALKHHFPRRRDAWVDAVRERCLTALRAGDIGDVTIDLLAHVRAEAIAELRKAATEGGCLQAFDTLREELSRVAIEVLGSVPKGVSQSNAEDLLSRRVYTDPGHFLIELLQNAEDAGARIWKVIFDHDRLIVWHDGKPFDARDVVGVCSIGQTTKRKSQIGFFGVGFKSVYEVTTRPRIYSDVWRFEIADVSVPKRLSAWPDDLPRDGTVLVLPLRDPSDPVRSPAALYQKAVALDPCVLLTLRSMDVLDFHLTEAAGGPAHHILTEVAQPAVQRTSIHQQPKGWTRHYRLEARDYRWPGGARDAARPTETPFGPPMGPVGPPMGSASSRTASLTIGVKPACEALGVSRATF